MERVLSGSVVDEADNAIELVSDHNCDGDDLRDRF